MGMDRIVDIATDHLHLSAERGFLIVENDGGKQGRVPLDDIAAVIIHAHGVTWSTNLAVRLAERGAIAVLCAANHAPISYIAPIEGHFAQNERIRAQWEATLPARKRLWKHIVIAKLRMQASLLAAEGKEEAGALEHLARKVRSGDPENVEARGARRYWQALFGSGFRRDRSRDGANALLNYGYTVLRACVARSIIASGLHPSIGLHHANRLNAFALADDLVEPFRPLADAAVLQLTREDKNGVDGEAKRRLAALTAADMEVAGETTPMTSAVQRLCHSLAMSFQDRKAALALPAPPTPLLWKAFMAGPEGEEL